MPTVGKSWSVFSLLLFTVLNVVAADLSTMHGFERAFRAAHAKGDLLYFKDLVCEDDVSPTTLSDYYHTFGKHFGYVIRRIEVRPYQAPTNRWGWKPQWSVKPTNTLLVWYALDTRQPASSVEYTVGKKGTKFQFAVCKNGMRRPRLWVRSCFAGEIR